MTIRLTDAAKYYRELPHQIAAWNALQEQVPPEALKEFEELYRSAPAAKEPLDPPWLAPTLTFLRQWEGLRLEAYRCSAGVPTIGYGATSINGRPVQLGDTCTKEAAETLLRQQVLETYAPAVFRLLPMAQKWSPNRIAALVSFTFNLGAGALEESTLRKRLLAGEDPAKVVSEELPKWVHAGEAVSVGLERRRAAEVALFTANVSTPLQQQTVSNPLRVPYYSQRDSQVPGQADRMCFSSTCAMLVAYLKPGALSGANADDVYLKRVLQYGDTTSADAQLKALASYGIKAVFRQNCGWDDIERSIGRGIPAAIGVLHHGPSSKPQGGGHWLLTIGATSSHVLVNDPYGEMDLVRGGYLNAKGAGLAYSKANLGPRWMVEGPGTGWAILANG